MPCAFAPPSSAWWVHDQELKFQSWGPSQRDSQCPGHCTPGPSCSGAQVWGRKAVGSLRFAQGGLGQQAQCPFPRWETVVAGVSPLPMSTWACWLQPQHSYGGLGGTTVRPHAPSWALQDWPGALQVLDARLVSRRRQVGRGGLGQQVPGCRAHELARQQAPCSSPAYKNGRKLPLWPPASHLHAPLVAGMGH